MPKPSLQFVDAGLVKGLKSGFFGSVDFISERGIGGWVVDAEQQSSRDVQLLLDGILIAQFPANKIRSDIADILDSPCNTGFLINWSDFNLPAQISSFDDSYLCSILIRISGTSLYLPNNTTKTVRLAQIREWIADSVKKKKTTLPTIDDLGIIGALDHVSHECVTGWAMMTATPDIPVAITVVINDEIVATGVTDRARPDLADRGKRLYPCGFRVAVPKSAFTSIKCNIAVLANGGVLPGDHEFLFDNEITAKVERIDAGYIIASLSGWDGGEIRASLNVDGAHAGYFHFIKNTKTDQFEGRWAINGIPEDGRPHVFQVILDNIKTDPIIMSYPNYRSVVEQADNSSISGWAFREDNSSALELGLFQNEFCISTARATLRRADVQQQFALKSDQCGYLFTFDEPIDDTNITLEIRDYATGITLGTLNLAHRYAASVKFALAAARIAVNAQNTPFRHALMAPWICTQHDEVVLDYVEAPLRHIPTRSKVVTIVVPVYGGAVETAECLESVIEAKNTTDFRVVIINDASPDQLIHDYLRHLSERALPNIKFVTRKNNAGFSAGVNLGMVIAGQDDVILLNADTVVSDGWIDRMVNAAAQDDRIGTVTPFSNNGELVTVPYMCKTLPIANQELACQINQIAFECNEGELIDIPVGIGFCMFIRRECINDIGVFDQAKWGRGYGEEVDFCLKAISRGWRNVVTTDTFVVHRGNISFGDEKLQRVTESAKLISGMYPFYDGLIQRFIRSDPIRAARRKINLRLIASDLPKSRLLHLTHVFGGGTQTYVDDLSEMIEAEAKCSVVLRFSVNGSAELVFNMTSHRLKDIFVAEHVEVFSSSESDSLIAELKELNFELMHIHALFGAKPTLIECLTKMIPYNVTIHDYSWICPRVTMTIPGGTSCNVAPLDTSSCNNCLRSFQPHIGLKSLYLSADEDTFQYRQFCNKILEQAGSVFVGANDVAQRLISTGILANFKIIPHPAPTKSIFLKRKTEIYTQNGDTTIRIAIIGGISDIKGFHQFEATARRALARCVPLQFYVFGYTMNENAFQGLSNVSLLGKYEGEELDALVELHRPRFSMFLNQWPETFSYTLSHAFRLGLWPIATDIGAPAERIREAKFGTLVPKNSTADEIIDQIMLEARKAPTIAPDISYPTTWSEYTND